jgi:RNA-directed DNA polymerase
MEKLRHLTKRTRSGKLEDIVKSVNHYVIGWISYYRLATTPSVYKELDAWIRRLRQMVWKRWKRGKTRNKELRKLGVPQERAALGAVGKSLWHMSRTPVVHEALSNAFWRRTELESIEKRYFILDF